MTFTDDDLNKIKQLDKGASTSIGSDDLRALIARLEVAEKACMTVWPEAYKCSPRVFKDLNDWRKAAGK